VVGHPGGERKQALRQAWASSGGRKKSYLGKVRAIGPAKREHKILLRPEWEEEKRTLIATHGAETPIESTEKKATTRANRVTRGGKKLVGPEVCLGRKGGGKEKKQSSPPPQGFDTKKQPSLEERQGKGSMHGPARRIDLQHTKEEREKISKARHPDRRKRTGEKPTHRRDELEIYPRARRKSNRTKSRGVNIHRARQVRNKKSDDSAK